MFKCLENLKLVVELSQSWGIYMNEFLYLPPVIIIYRYIFIVIYILVFVNGLLTSPIIVFVIYRVASKLDTFPHSSWGASLLQLLCCARSWNADFQPPPFNSILPLIFVWWRYNVDLRGKSNRTTSPRWCNTKIHLINVSLNGVLFF